MKNLNENIGGQIENEFQDWLDMMYTDKDYPEIETLETVIDYAQDTLRDYRADYTVFESKKIENLNEGKNKKGKMTYEAALREIDAQSAIVAMEAKIEKLKEMAEAKETRLNMVSEDENLSELIDKRAMNEMKKEIKQIKKMQEKLERLYEKKNGKKPEVIDEDEEMNEYDSSTQMIPDKKEDGTYDMSSVGMKEEEIDEAHCTSEEDDTDSMNEEFLRMQKLAGIISEEEYKKKLNEESAGVFSGWADDMLGMEEPTFPKGTELRLRSKADAGKTKLEYYFQLADKKGDGNLQVYITVGDEPSIKYRANNLDDNKVKAYLEKRKDDFVRYFDFIAQQNSKEEMGKKYHVGSGYEDKVTDEDVASIKDGIKKLKSLKIETLPPR
jgi:hypothetical protein